MVGVVIVSHSARIAKGVAELAREMGGSEVRLETAGGLEAVEGPDGPEHPIGTDAVLVMQAIERAWSDDGVLVLMDLGSAVLSAEMAVDLIGDERRDRILLCEAPLVEGAVAAAVTAKLGMPLEAVAAEARSGLAGKIAHLATDAEEGARPTVAGEPSGEPGAASAEAGATAVAVFPVDLPHGLHARPAARFVQTAAGYEASVSVRNVTTGVGPADASSLNAVATLGVRAGHEVEVRAEGPGARDAIAEIRALAARRFDEPLDATAVETAALPEPVTEPDRGTAGAFDEGVVTGFAASPGVAVGELRRFHTPPLDVPETAGTDPAEEHATLDAALRATADAIVAQRDAVALRAGEDEASIFDAHLLFLRDEALLGPARRAIAERGRTAAVAWRDAVDAVAAEWDVLDDEYMRARAIDLRSVGAQVLARVLGVPVPAPRLDEPGILVAADLTPADTAGLDPAMTLGIVTVHGGPTSHAAVLARALGIPAVVGVGPRVLSLAEGSSLAVDGASGEVVVDPPPDVVARFESERRERAERLAGLLASAGEPATTIDGTTVEVAANVGGPAEVAAAVAAGADGIGLFRTEFLFMDRAALPDEDEQEAAYRAAGEALDGRPLLVRTLDAGADKPVAALGQAREENPFLGVRGIRLGLARPELLLAQLRALLRVAVDHPVRVMFPMIATTGELEEARAALDRARRETALDPAIEVGIMVEVPSAALTAASLAADADFFSIGTNDLTQYTLAADRGNEHVAALNDPLHPAVLRLIAATADGAETHGRWVGVCGELAGDELATALLLGLGVRELSMAAPAIASVKDAVRSTTVADARAIAARALACTTAAEVRDLLGSA
ncbi:MAG TPA: phosphoenolpyruvate--protein phosphotransferase [Actinomycetota bacterium]|nr:phosphoenolpyruvate--protein phosphotransferase [Actinomycetota bacterium]